MHIAIYHWHWYIISKVGGAYICNICNICTYAYSCIFLHIPFAYLCISGAYQVHIRCIFCAYYLHICAYLLHICCIFVAYLLHICCIFLHSRCISGAYLCIFLAYFLHISCIFMHIPGIFLAYFCISGAYQVHIRCIFVYICCILLAYFLHICAYFCAFLAYFCISGAYQVHIRAYICIFIHISAGLQGFCTGPTGSAQQRLALQSSHMPSHHSPIHPISGQDYDCPSRNSKKKKLAKLGSYTGRHQAQLQAVYVVRREAEEKQCIGVGASELNITHVRALC